MSGDIVLSAGVRANLLSLQKTADLMAQTQQRIASAGLRAEVLPPRSDLDTPEDYRRLLASGLITT